VAFALSLDVLPTSGTGGMKHLNLPAVTLSLTYISTYIRHTEQHDENMNEEYVLYADARGLRRKTVIFGHVLRNSLHTCVTALGMSVPQLIAGTVVIENILPARHRPPVHLRDLQQGLPRDPGLLLIMGVLFIFCNLAVDILHCLMDPRLRSRMMFLSRLARDRTAVACLAIVAVVILAGIFADRSAAERPDQGQRPGQFRSSAKFPLGTDHLGRCTLSRLVHGIRPTVLLLSSPCLPLALGTRWGSCPDIPVNGGRTLHENLRHSALLPSQVMILAVVGVLGPG
jgi:hypothetical protein